MKDSSVTHIDKHSFDLSGKTAFITGAAGLLGMVHAEALARHGFISGSSCIFQPPGQGTYSSVRDRIDLARKSK